MAKPNEGRSRAVVENVQPELDCGRFPIKRIVGDIVVVEADVFGDGHDEVRARLLWKQDTDPDWQAIEMQPLGNDRWQGEFSVEKMGRYGYTIVGEVDHFGTWRSDLRKRIAAQQDLKLPFATGANLLEQVQPRASKQDSKKLAAWAKSLRTGSDDSVTAELALRDELAETVKRYPDAALGSRFDRKLEIVVDRERARFSSWYELFPRSWSTVPGQHGTLRDVTARMDYVADMGFDVLYLPPISPIGQSFRKGKNNAVEAAPGEEGSPWAIGSAEGGHTAIHPALGTMADFQALVKRALQLKMEVALDIAFQCAPDHPWVTEHPEFFKKRPDGSIQYAENPPKKYQDIYPLDFESSNWQGLWDALKGVFTFWMDQGVRIFRVDNPHTKAFPFWQWVIPELKAKGPDVLFLAEAFTRPRVMERLAKVGFPSPTPTSPGAIPRKSLRNICWSSRLPRYGNIFTLTSGPTLPTSWQKACRAEVCRPFAAAWYWRQPWPAITGSTDQRSSWETAPPPSRAAKNTWTQRNTRSRPGISKAPPV
jgi:starch synthase (maltosyl-transferring)